MIFLYCKLGSRIAHYNKLPRKNIDIGRYHLSAVSFVRSGLNIANGENCPKKHTTDGESETKAK